MQLNSSYNSVKNSAREGLAIVNAAKCGAELQKYKEGQKVQSTKVSPYNFTNGVIIEAYKDNGFWYYTVEIDGFKKTFRQKDITAIKEVKQRAKNEPSGEWCVTYAKIKGCTAFKAIDVNGGFFVGNILYATQIRDTELNRAKLQRLADENKERAGLVLQLREGTKVRFQTK